ncbi:MAG: IclR family transcriptional regulator, partial [Dehalococcoidales bacterium]|nr:IclR family transcriptional regulator [Dehalococcoidales bacterium]
SNGINSATEIAGYCSYSISTVHRLLQNLTELGWVIQDESSHKYFLGPLVSRLSSNEMSTHRYLVLRGLKEMSNLSNLTEETIILGILDQLHFRKLHEIPSRHNLRIHEESDRLKGQYVGATAKVLLSQLDDEDLKTALKHIKSEHVTETSVTDPSLIREQIEEIRRSGYSVSFGERIPGAACISAVVKHYYCPVALYIVGLESRMRPRLNEFIVALTSGAQRISDEIAGTFDGQGGGGMMT